MRVVGLDLSLTATGISTEEATSVARFPKLSGCQRLQVLRDLILVHTTNSALVVIEEYAYSKGDAHAHKLGELGGVVRLALFERGRRFVTVQGTTMKKFATGKGTAKKDQVLAAAVKAGADVDDNNAADAWWLRQMALYRVERSEVGRTSYRDEAVSAVDWESREAA